MPLFSMRSQSFTLTQEYLSMTHTPTQQVRELLDGLGIYVEMTLQVNAKRAPRHLAPNLVDQLEGW